MPAIYSKHNSKDYMLKTVKLKDKEGWVQVKAQITYLHCLCENTNLRFNNSLCGIFC